MDTSGRTRVLPWNACSGGLPENETTFARILQQQGYSTGLIGKWHQGVNCHSRTDHCHHPLRHGFDYFYGMPLTLLSDCHPGWIGQVSSAMTPKLWHYTQLMALGVLTLAAGRTCGLVPVPRKAVAAAAGLVFLFFASWYTSFGFVRRWNCILMRNRDVVEQPMDLERTAGRLLEEAVAYIERNQHRPFLLFLSLLHVHLPLVTGRRFRGKSQHGLYGDNVEEMDWIVGEILRAVEDNGLRNRTLVYFTSDHGGCFESTDSEGQLGGWNGVYRASESEPEVPALSQPVVSRRGFWSLGCKNTSSLDAKVETNQHRPFLLFLSLLHVHLPLVTGRRFRGKSQHGLYGDNVEEMDWIVVYFGAKNPHPTESLAKAGGRRPGTRSDAAASPDGAPRSSALSGQKRASKTADLFTDIETDVLLRMSSWFTIATFPAVDVRGPFPDDASAGFADGSAVLSAGRLCAIARRCEILRAVEDNGLRNRTLVYFTSDHGGCFESTDSEGQLGGWNGVYRASESEPEVPALSQPVVCRRGFWSLGCKNTSSLDAKPPCLRPGGRLWKVHFMTPRLPPGEARTCYSLLSCPCSGEGVTWHSPPLLFDLSRDPSEAWPLTPGSEPLYHAVIARVDQAVREHEETLSPVPPQLSLGNILWKPWLQPCCGTFPFCSCSQDGDRGDM
ncbi:arylsulfatase D-like [Pteropus vampyrus]|uniref:Arylsulfatase D-like n=1 Tax=Pteropus vampyrus TaxID=132908 RepID=A0A6P6C0A7_PTEVA|nr:arylsulfatase D-like [Pteropus vampyrus]